MRASMSATARTIRDWTSAVSAAKLSTLRSPLPADSLAYSEEELVQDLGGRVPGEGRVRGLVGHEPVQDAGEELPVGGAGGHPAQVARERVVDELAGFEDDLEIRRVAQVHGRGLEDGGHEAVDGRDLEVGVFVQDPVDRLARPGPPAVRRRAIRSQAPGTSPAARGNSTP